MPQSWPGLLPQSQLVLCADDRLVFVSPATPVMRPQELTAFALQQVR